MKTVALLLAVISIVIPPAFGQIPPGVRVTIPFTHVVGPSKSPVIPVTVPLPGKIDPKRAIVLISVDQGEGQTDEKHPDMWATKIVDIKPDHLRVHVRRLDGNAGWALPIRLHIAVFIH